MGTVLTSYDSSWTQSSTSSTTQYHTRLSKTHSTNCMKTITHSCHPYLPNTGLGFSYYYSVLYLMISSMLGMLYPDPQDLRTTSVIWDSTATSTTMTTTKNCSHIMLRYHPHSAKHTGRDSPAWTTGTNTSRAFAESWRSLSRPCCTTWITGYRRRKSSVLPIVLFRLLWCWAWVSLLLRWLGTCCRLAKSIGGSRGS